MKDLLMQLFHLTQSDMQQIQEIIASLPACESEVLSEQAGKLRYRAQLGHLQATNPGVLLDRYGRLVKCSSCNTTENLHDDMGSGGPYRCSSSDCVMF